MRASSVPFLRGASWVLEGFRLLKRSPLQLTMLGLFYLLALLLSATIPVAGMFLPWLLTPVLSIGLMSSARMVDQGIALPLGGLLPILAQGFRDRQGRAWRPLLLLGLVNILSVVLAMAIASLVDGGVLFEFITGQRSSKDPDLASSSAQYSSLVFLAVYVPTQMALWYAPALTSWEGIAPSKSLFFSFVSVARNKWAFAAYFLTWLILLMVMALALRVLTAALGGSAVMVLALVSPLLYTGLYCSFWPSYRDVFNGPQPALAP
jgi:hypothetical protein